MGLRGKLVSVKQTAHPGNGAPVGGLVIVGPRRSTGVEGLWKPEMERFLVDAFLLVQQAGGSLRQEGRAKGAFLATVSRLDGAFGLCGLSVTADPLSGGLAGLAKTAAREWPEVRAKAIDVPWSWTDAAGIAKAICLELFLEGPGEVGLSPDGAIALELRSVPLERTTQTDPLSRGDVVVLTGGARGVTAETAIALARAFSPTLALLGRTPSPGPEPEWLAALTAEAAIKRALLAHAPAGSLAPQELEAEYRRQMAAREVRSTLARIEAAGSRAAYVAVDVRDDAAVRETIARIRSEHGPIRGIVHGAGVLADRLLLEKTPEQFGSVLETKVSGLRALLSATAGDDLRILVLFSSVSGRFGRTGQVDYSMANEVLNKVARHQAVRRPGCRVLALNWGPWDGGMVTPALKKIFLKEGVGVIGLTAGADQMAAELGASRGGDVEVVLTGTIPTPDSVETEVAARPVAAKAEGSSAPLAVAFHREIDLERLPFRGSHVLNGRPVMPRAMPAEWLAHAALHANPGLVYHGFDRLRVMRGIILGDQPLGVQALTGRATRDDPIYSVPVELRSSDGRVLFASSTVLLSGQLPHPNGAGAGFELGSGRAYPCTVDEAYERFLFHGSHFRAIEAIDECSEAGISAWVRRAPAPAKWMRDPLRDWWLADPLVLDAVFQLMILWSFDQQGAGCLPCHVASYRQYKVSYPSDSVRVSACITGQTAGLVRADVLFTDRAGDLIARMDGFESTIDPHLKEVFQRRSVGQGLETAGPVA
jgi:NAD(P)-dependent dehydrogenase (short-subunit alcohol dehydrogenase family)